MKPLKINDLFQLTRLFLTQLYGLEKRPYWMPHQLQEYQLGLLRKRLDDARQYVPLYQKKDLPNSKEIRSLDDWQKLPLLTKDALLEGPPENRLNSKYKIEDLVLSKSSGSTGKALDVYYDVTSFNLFILAGFRMYRMAFNYLPWHRQTYIYTSPYPMNSLFGMFPMHFISTLNPIEDTIAKLRSNPPDLLVCYPSHLRSIADRMTQEDFKIIQPKAINVNSEMSSSKERSYLSEKFRCHVFDDYSSEELTRIASQCRHLNYHIFGDINYIEIVDDDGQPVPNGQVGNIVGSNLHNRAMPLLRYLQGDRGSLSHRTCECGRKFPLLEKFQGRQNDAFILSTGEILSSGFLLDLTYEVFLKYPGSVQAFCLVQEAPDQWTLEMVPGTHWTPSLESAILGDIIRNLKRDQVTIGAKIVQDVTKTKSGKANPIISRVSKKESQK